MFSMENDATVSDALSIQWPAARHPARSDTWPVVLDPAEEYPTRLVPMSRFRAEDRVPGSRHRRTGLREAPVSMARPAGWPSG